MQLSNISPCYFSISWNIYIIPVLYGLPMLISHFHICAISLLFICEFLLSQCRSCSYFPESHFHFLETCSHMPCQMLSHTYVNHIKLPEGS